jgi:hypothetical protein
MRDLPVTLQTSRIIFILSFFASAPDLETNPDRIIKTHRMFERRIDQEWNLLASPVLFDTHLSSRARFERPLCT